MAAANAAEPEIWQPAANPWLIAISVMLATFMEVLDTSIAAVALPYIAGSVSATNDEATWVLTSYLVANAVILPASSWFGLRFGRKRFLVTCIIIFTVASFLCGAAPTLGILLLARAIQGAGGGALQPIAQAILLESFPPEKRGIAAAVYGLGVVVAPVLGPTFGGYLTDQVSWRWSFYINIPIGLFAVFMILRYVEDPPYIKNARPGRIDGWGLGLLAVWLGCLQIILDKGQEVDWFGAVWIRWTAVAFVLGLVFFIMREWLHEKPLVDLTIFSNRNFAVGCVLITLFGAAIYGAITLLPLFYQELLGYTAFSAGWAVSPRGIGAILAMPIIGILTTRLDNRFLIAAGFGLFAACSFWWGQLTLDISQWSLLWPIVLSGFGSGMVFVPLSTVTMGTLLQRQIGNASGLYNLLRNVGGSVGISIVNTIVARHAQLHRNDISHSLGGTNPILQNRLDSFTHVLTTTNAEGPVRATLGAWRLIEQTLDTQARTWSYIDDFRYMALVCFGCVPIVFLLKRARRRPGVVHAD